MPDSYYNFIILFNVLKTRILMNHPIYNIVYKIYRTQVGRYIKLFKFDFYIDNVYN